MPATGKGILAPGGTPSRTAMGPQVGFRRNTLLSSQYKYIVNGTLAKLNATIPNIGDMYLSNPVMDAYIQPSGDGIKGEMTIITENRLTPTNYIFEVDWQQIQKPLESHPKYASGGALALSATDWAQIAAWDQEPDPALRGAYHWISTSNTLSSNAQNFALKKLQGVNAYIVAAPIARATSNLWLALTVGACLGTFSSSAPFAGCPAGYQWLKVTDRARRDSSYWERTEEWMGADKWDSDLYN